MTVMTLGSKTPPRSDRSGPLSWEDLIVKFRLRREFVAASRGLKYWMPPPVDAGLFGDGFGGFGQPSPVPTHRSGLCILDGPNMRHQLFDILGRAPRKRSERLNLKLLRQFLRTQMGVTRFVFVVEYESHRKVQDRLRRYVRRCGWRFLEPERSKFGVDESDPVTDYISWRLDSLVELWGPKMPVVCLVSNSDTFAPLLARFRDIGGHVGIAGFLGRIQPKLYDLTGDDPLSEAAVQLIDLAVDVGAIKLPKEAVTYTDEPTEAERHSLIK